MLSKAKCSSLFKIIYVSGIISSSVAGRPNDYFFIKIIMFIILIRVLFFTEHFYHILKVLHSNPFSFNYMSVYKE